MEREFWEQRYGEREHAYGTQANAFLVSQGSHIQPGMTVLAVGDGQGRNGVWLAQQGCTVLSVDYAQAGLDRALDLAANSGVSLETLCTDLFTWQWPENQYDAVVTIFVHFPPDQRARMHHKMIAACKPGGVVIFEGFSKQQRVYQQKYQSGGPPVDALLYTRQMLEQDFAGARILLMEETETELCEGRYHSGKAAVIRLVAQREK